MDIQFNLNGEVGSFMMSGYNTNQPKCVKDQYASVEKRLQISVYRT